MGGREGGREGRKRTLSVPLTVNIVALSVGLQDCTRNHTLFALDAHCSSRLHSFSAVLTTGKIFLEEPTGSRRSNAGGNVVLNSLPIDVLYARIFSCGFSFARL